MSKLPAWLAPNRIAVYLTSLVGLLTALLAIWGDLDWTSVVGILGSLVLILGVVVKWLDGWQKYEERQAIGASPYTELAGQDLLAPAELGRP